MRKYEGLFILNEAAQELGIPEAIETVSEAIVADGGKVETVQKMEKRSFVRVANKKHQSGYYINIIFEAPPDVIAKLIAKFRLHELVFRFIFTSAPVEKAVAPTA